MNEIRNIKVVKTDGSAIQVRLNSFDIARSLALAGSLTEPVIIIHKGHCLYPFMSIASQDVADGDVVVLKPVKATQNQKSLANEICSKPILNNRHIRSSKQEKRYEYMKPEEKANQSPNNYSSLSNYRIFEELLRISDLQFNAYESSISGGFAYQQMAEILNNAPSPNDDNGLNVQSTENNDNSKSENLKTESNPNDVPLPVFWSTTDEEFNNQNQMKNLLFFKNNTSISNFVSKDIPNDLNKSQRHI